MSRTGRVQRTTSESDVLVELDLDGTGRTEISTTVPFYDHMLDQLGKRADRAARAIASSPACQSRATRRMSLPAVNACDAAPPSSCTEASAPPSF